MRTGCGSGSFLTTGLTGRHAGERTVLVFIIVFIVIGRYCVHEAIVPRRVSIWLGTKHRLRPGRMWAGAQGFCKYGCEVATGHGFQSGGSVTSSPVVGWMMDRALGALSRSRMRCMNAYGLLDTRSLVLDASL